MQPKDIIFYHELPGKPREVVSAEIFSLYNMNYLSIVDYHGKFPVTKKMVDISRQLNPGI